MKISLIFTFSLFTFLFLTNLSSQSLSPVLDCGQASLRTTLPQQLLMDSLELEYRNRQLLQPIENGNSINGAESNPPPYVLPVVVHIIHNNGNENLSTARVLQGIDFLNQSFANTDYYDQQTGVNTQIQFCLAQRTPDNQSTSGITYHQSVLTDLDFTDDLAMKDLARWDPTQYINVYIVKEICMASCSVAGYAYLPSAHGAAFDGIVMEARWLGDNEAGNSVLTHEMGHYLGLYHTFEGGCGNNDCTVDGDRVCDTPPDQSTVPVPCSGSANSCTTDTDSGFPTDQNDMFNNYMDYGNFSCYNALTQGQTDRMYFFIEGIRNSLLNSQACLSPCPALTTASFDQNPIGTVFDIGQVVDFTNQSINGVDFSWYVNGVLASTATDFNISLNNPGGYEIKLVVGATSSLCLADSIIVNLQAVCTLDAGYAADNPNPELGETVTFSANQATVSNYEWTVNNAIVSNTDQLNYLFDQPGIYEVCLSLAEGECLDEQCSFYFINSPPTTDDCFGSSGISLYAFNAGNTVTSGPLTPDQNGGFWQAIRIDDELVLQQLDGNGNILDINSLDIFDNTFETLFDMELLSDGSLLLCYRESASNDRTSYFLRYDPATDAVIYRKAMTFAGSMYDFIPVPDQQDQFIVLYDLSPSETSNSSNEAWIFDIDGMTGDFGNSWNYQTQQGGPHTYSHGIFRQGELWTIGRIGVTSLLSSFRAGIGRFDAPNNLSDLNIFHRPTNTSARLYGNQLIPVGNDVFSIHSGNPTGTSATTNYWAYLNLWQQEQLSWTREYRRSGSQRMIIYGGKAQGEQLFFMARSFSQNSSTTIVLSTDLMGNLLWANEYEIPTGRLVLAGAITENLLYVTNNSLIIPASLEATSGGGGNQAAALLRLNLDGTVDDDCVTVIPVDIIANEVATVSENFDMNQGIRLPSGNNQESALTDRQYSRFTACADSCDVNTDDCGLTGEQFTQVWDAQLDEEVQGHAIIADGNGGLIVTGSSESFIFINRLNLDGTPSETYTIDIPTAPGKADVVCLEITDNEKLLLGGFIPPRPGMIRTGFYASFDLSTNTLDWWNEMDDDANVTGLHQIENTTEFILSGSRTFQLPDDNVSFLLQRRNISDGSLSGTLHREYDYTSNSDHILTSRLVGNTLYSVTRITGISGNAQMRASISQFNITTGDELLTLHAAPAMNTVSRTYGSGIVVDQNNMYVLYKGDMNGVGSSSVSKVYLTKLTTSGEMIWGREYDILNYSGEEGLSLHSIDDDLVISGNGYGPRDIFSMRISKANADLIWAKGYRNTSANLTAFHVWYDQNMLVTNSNIFLSTYIETSPGVQLPQLISLNTAGNIATGTCLEAYDLEITFDDLDPWIEMSLNDWPTPLGDLSFSPAQGTIDFQLLTPCLDSCEVSVNEEICDNGIDDDGDGFIDCEDPGLANTCCCTEGPSVQLPPDTSICPTDTYVIHPVLINTGMLLSWTGGSNADSLIINSPGLYELTTTDSCGRTATDQINITFIPSLGPPELGPDLVVCDNGVVEASAGNGYSSYLWSNATTDSVTTFFDPGTHWVRVTDGCGNVFSDTVSISVIPATELNLPELINFCPQDSQLISVTGFINYEWFSEVSIDCSNCAAITIYAPPVGDTAVYTLLADDNNGCFSYDSVIVTTQPLTGLNSNASICAGESFDFNGTILTEAGVYTAPSLCGGTDTLNLTILSPSATVQLSETICTGDSLLIFGLYRDEAGVYTDTLNAVNGCDSAIQFVLTVIDPPISTTSLSICSGDSVLIFGEFVSEAGTYSMTFAQPGQPCDSSAIIILEVNAIPEVGILVTQESCDDTTAVVNLTTNSITTQISWADPELFGTELELNTGIYPVSIVSTDGCILDTSVVVNIATSLDIDLVIIPPTCPEGSDGYISLLPPNTNSVVFMNGDSLGIMDSVGGLAAGNYQLEILDTVGCVSSERVSIQDPLGFQLLLPEDTIIHLGDEIRIIGRLFGIPPEEVRLNWLPSDYLDCDTCLVVSSKPNESITYQLSATDSLGCIRLEDIRISVDKQARIYVPNGFSPNGDGVNDVFFPNFASEVEQVELLQIHERWGGMVYQRLNFPPNDPAYGWDGTVNGKLLDPNVFVWHIRVRLYDGTTLSISGDLTLVR